MDLLNTTAAATETTATVDLLGDGSHDYNGLAILFVSVWGQVRGAAVLIQKETIGLSFGLRFHFYV